MDERGAERHESAFLIGWRSWIRTAVVLLLVAVAGLALAACGDDNGDGGDGGGDGTPAAGGDGGLLEQAREQGYITIGIANEPPYGYLDENGEPTGEAPEVAKAILAELGIPEVRAEVVEFQSLIPGLNAGRFDMIAAGMFINADRAEQILFSDPDYCVQQSFAVAEGNPLGITDFASIAANSDVRLGILQGAVEEGYALDAGVSEDQITSFPDVAAMFDALENDRVDAVALTRPSIEFQVEQRADAAIEATEPFFVEGAGPSGCGGYGFRFEDQEFRDAFNDVLKEMQENDEIFPIVEEFGFTQEEINRAKDLTVEDLTQPAE